MILGQLTDFMIVILLVAAVIEAVISELRSSIVLLTVVVINVVIGFNQELKASRALEALVTLTVPHVLPLPFIILDKKYFSKSEFGA
jgi:P-type Ca2+ transporter type 2C